MTTELRLIILLVLILLTSCGQKSEVEKNEKTDSLIGLKVLTEDIYPGFTLETIPKNWGQISTIENDTFKVIECFVLSQIKIYDSEPHSYFKIESFYMGTDSLLIKDFQRITSDNYEFNLQSIKQDSSLTITLEITDQKMLIGNWTIRRTGEQLGMTLANADKRNFATTNYPCD